MEIITEPPSIARFYELSSSAEKAANEDNQKHVPFTASPLDAWRGANKPVEPKRIPKSKTKGQKKSASVGPPIRRVGPVTLEFS